MNVKVYWLEVTLTTLYIEASDNTVTVVPVSASRSHTGEGNMLHRYTVYITIPFGRVSNLCHLRLCGACECK